MLTNGYTDNMMHNESVLASPINRKGWMDIESGLSGGEELSFHLSTSWQEEENTLTPKVFWEKFINFLIRQSETWDVVAIAFCFGSESKFRLVPA